MPFDSHAHKPQTKDSAWLLSASKGIHSYDHPTPEMVRLIAFHELRVRRLLKQATLYVYWYEGDTEATVSIMPVYEFAPGVPRKITEEEARAPFEVIKLPFPPVMYDAQILWGWGIGAD